MKIVKKLRYLHTCHNGLAALEFALILPLLIVMFVGMVEIVRLAIIHEKVRVASHTVGDLLTRSSTATIAGLSAYADTVPLIMKPFDFDGTVIFTSIASSGSSDPVRGGNSGPGKIADVRRCKGGCIVWQERFEGTDVSKIGTVGKRAKLPPGFKMEGRQNLVIVEIFHNFTPILPFTDSIISSLTDQVTYSSSIFKPRQEDLLDPPI